MTDISVVMPFYRAEQWFSAALASVRGQSLAPAEIIVVVDGDTPAARAFFADAHYADLRIDYLAQNRGAAAARNRGVALAASPLIAFMDADDLWRADKLERQLAFLAEHPDMAACHTGVETFDRAGSVLATYLEKPSPLTLRDLLLGGSHVVPSSLMVRREVFAAVGGFDEQYRTSEDHELSLRLVKAGHEIGFVNEALTRLRRAGQGNLSSNGVLLLRHHARIARRYASDLRRVDGPFASARFLGRYLQEDGARIPGVRGLVVRITGRVLGAVFGRPGTSRQGQR